MPESVPMGMWSTKEKHKWSGAVFLGGKYEEHRDKLSQRFKGKQISTIPLKKGNAATRGVLFTRFEGPKVKDPYDVGNMYLQSHPLDQRKMGFGTRDAPKKGEFMSQQRAAQYKHAVTKNSNIDLVNMLKSGSIESQVDKMKERIAQLEDLVPGLCTERTKEGDFVKDVAKHTYDYGRTPEATTPVFLKDNQDKFYSIKRCLHENKPRHVPKYSTANAEYGTAEMGVLDRMRNKPVA